MIDDDLMVGARQAQERLVDAEHDAELARAEFHHAVRRLHLRGASLRELADELHLSHQRIHQIVEAAGGTRRWRRRARPASELNCSFCGRPQRKTRKLVAGPDVHICEQCIAIAVRVITNDRPEETHLGEIRAVPASESRSRCSFCGRRRRHATGLATTIDNPVGKLGIDAAICSECLALCKEIHAEQLT